MRALVALLLLTFLGSVKGLDAVDTVSVMQSFPNSPFPVCFNFSEEGEFPYALQVRRFNINTTEVSEVGTYTIPELINTESGYKCIPEETLTDNGFYTYSFRRCDQNLVCENLWMASTDDNVAEVGNQNEGWIVYNDMIPVGGETFYEAESATIIGDAFIDNSIPNYYGDGYVVMNKGSRILFNEVINSGGQSVIRIRYYTDKNIDTILYINDFSIPITLTKNTVWAVNVLSSELKTGPNVISLYYGGPSKNGPIIDYISIE